MAATRRACRQWWGGSGMILFMLLLYAPNLQITESSSTRHCFFNQLCSCKIVGHLRTSPNEARSQQSVDDFGNVDYYDGAPVVTERQPPEGDVFQGQFGTISSTSE